MIRKRPIDPREFNDDPRLDREPAPAIAVPAALRAGVDGGARARRAAGGDGRGALGCRAAAGDPAPPADGARRGRPGIAWARPGGSGRQRSGSAARRLAGGAGGPSARGGVGHRRSRIRGIAGRGLGAARLSRFRRRICLPLRGRDLSRRPAVEPASAIARILFVSAHRRAAWQMGRVVPPRLAIAARGDEPRAPADMAGLPAGGHRLALRGLQARPAPGRPARRHSRCGARRAFSIFPVQRRLLLHPCSDRRGGGAVLLDGRRFPRSASGAHRRPRRSGARPGRPYSPVQHAPLRRAVSRRLRLARTNPGLCRRILDRSRRAAVPRRADAVLRRHDRIAVARHGEVRRSAGEVRPLSSG